MDVKELSSILHKNVGENKKCMLNDRIYAIMINKYYIDKER